jgi:hypothetical protein
MGINRGENQGGKGGELNVEMRRTGNHGLLIRRARVNFANKP